MSVLNGALSYRKSTNDFYVNETGTNDGWVPLPLSIDPEELTSKDIDKLLEKLGGSNQSQYFVDGSNPNASDTKDNKGNSKLRPFRTLERALLEVARRSFKKGSGNDLYERISIIIAPGEYEINNAPSGALNTFTYYDEYQFASNLILKNADWIINTAWNTVPLVNRTEKCKTDLRYFLNALANDLSEGGNSKSLIAARTIITTDTNLNCNVDPNNPSVPGVPDSGYFIPAYADLTKRNQTIIALNTLIEYALKAMRNEGPNKDLPTIIGSLADTEIADTIDDLIKISINTLNCLIDPRIDIVLDFGAPLNFFPNIGEPTQSVFQSFNFSNRAGVILPRGVSIIGEDLRKVVFRPKYVPNRDGSDNETDGRGAIFRMTGGNFFSGFTIKDNREIAAEGRSHHNLSAFEFCPPEQLDDYYEKIRTAFEDKTIYYRALDAANLLDKNIEWISKKSIPDVVASEYLNYAKIFEAEIYNFILALIKDLRDLEKNAIMEFGQRFRSAHILTLPNTVVPDSDPQITIQEAAENYYNALFDSSMAFIQLAINNEANLAEGGYQNPYIIIDTEGTTAEYPLGSDDFLNGRCADILAAIYTYRDIVKNLISGIAIPTYEISDTFIVADTEVREPETSIVLGLTPAEEQNPPEADNINTVLGASPYIFNASIRSEYGMCGIDGDGSKVTGLKSYLAAQFTIVSLQKDTNAFILGTSEEINPDAYYSIGQKRFKGSKITDDEDWRHFGYRVSNGAYAQLVSCFCIGPALHYPALSGAEFSITNSTSNFGDVSLYSFGSVEGTDGKGSFAQDSGHKLLGIIKPKSIDLSDTSTSNPSLKLFALGPSISKYEVALDAISAPAMDSQSWINPEETGIWKSWASDHFTEFNPIDNVAGVDYPISFTNVTFVKLTLRGSFANLGDSVIEYDENGVPIIDYLYVTASSLTEISDPKKTLDDIDYPTVSTGYNANLNEERRAKVHSIVTRDEDGIRFYDLVLDLTDSSGSRGEWFERQTYQTTPDSEGNYTSQKILTTRLLGIKPYIKRFVDNRKSIEKRYKFIFLRGLNENGLSRIPPENFILKKHTGVTSPASQPFQIKTGTNSELNTAFYITDITSYKTEEDFKADWGDFTLIKHSPPTESKYFIAELISSNSDLDLRKQTTSDLSLNSIFNITDDAELVASLNNKDDYLNKESIEDYISKFNTKRIISLLGDITTINNITVDSALAVDTNSNNSARVVLLDPNNVYEMGFNKPSIIRCGGQTWEYMGYYNYSDGIPSLQKEGLGDRIDSFVLKNRFIFEKIKKEVAGGRVYAIGMDELGRIIEGDQLRDLKTNTVERIIEGTSPDLINLSEEQAQDTIFTLLEAGSIEIQNELIFNTENSKIVFEGSGSIEAESNTRDFSELQIDFKSVLLMSNSNPGDNLTIGSILLSIDENNKTILDLSSADTEVLLGNSVAKLEVNSDIFNPNLVGDVQGWSTIPYPTTYKLARPATYAELQYERNAKIDEIEDNQVFVTPKMLGDWRKTQRLISSSSVSQGVIVIFVGQKTTRMGGSPSLIVTSDQVIQREQEIANDPLTSQTPYDLSDGTVAFLNLIEAIKYCNQKYTEEDNITFSVRPGIYILNFSLIDNEIKFGLIISGANNTGQIGRFDGRDRHPTRSIDLGLNPGAQITSDISSAIIVITNPVKAPDETPILNSSSSITIDGANAEITVISNTFQLDNVIIWDNLVYSEFACKYLWKEEIISLSQSVENWDSLTQTQKDSIEYNITAHDTNLLSDIRSENGKRLGLISRSSMLSSASANRHKVASNINGIVLPDDDTDAILRPNSKGFNHPSFYEHVVPDYEYLRNIAVLEFIFNHNSTGQITENEIYRNMWSQSFLNRFPTAVFSLVPTDSSKRMFVSLRGSIISPFTGYFSFLGLNAGLVNGPGFGRKSLDIKKYDINLNGLSIRGLRAYKNLKKFFIRRYNVNALENTGITYESYTGGGRKGEIRCGHFDRINKDVLPLVGISINPDEYIYDPNNVEDTLEEIFKEIGVYYGTLHSFIHAYGADIFLNPLSAARHQVFNYPGPSDRWDYTSSSNSIKFEKFYMGGRFVEEGDDSEILGSFVGSYDSASGRFLVLLANRGLFKSQYGLTSGDATLSRLGLRQDTYSSSKNDLPPAYRLIDKNLLGEAISLDHTFDEPTVGYASKFLEYLDNSGPCFYSGAFLYLQRDSSLTVRDFTNNLYGGAGGITFNSNYLVPRNIESVDVLSAATLFTGENEEILGREYIIHSSTLSIEQKNEIKKIMLLDNSNLQQATGDPTSDLNSNSIGQYTRFYYNGGVFSLIDAGADVEIVEAYPVPSSPLLSWNQTIADPTTQGYSLLSNGSRGGWLEILGQIGNSYSVRLNSIPSSQGTLVSPGRFIDVATNSTNVKINYSSQYFSNFFSSAITNDADNRDDFRILSGDTVSSDPLGSLTSKQVIQAYLLKQLIYHNIMPLIFIDGIWGLGNYVSPEYDYSQEEAEIINPALIKSGEKPPYDIDQRSLFYKGESIKLFKASKEDRRIRSCDQAIVNIASFQIAQEAGVTLKRGKKYYIGFSQGITPAILEQISYLNRRYLDYTYQLNGHLNGIIFTASKDEELNDLPRGSSSTKWEFIELFEDNTTYIVVEDGRIIRNWSTVTKNLDAKYRGISTVLNPGYKFDTSEYVNTFVFARGTEDWINKIENIVFNPGATGQPGDLEITCVSTDLYWNTTLSVYQPGDKIRIVGVDTGDYDPYSITIEGIDSNTLFCKIYSLIDNPAPVNTTSYILGETYIIPNIGYDLRRLPTYTYSIRDTNTYRNLVSESTIYF